MTDHRIEANGVAYHVRVQGSGQPLMLLHGFTGSLQNWEPIVPPLAESYQIVTVDLLGHGQTDAPANPERYAMPNAAADLIAIADDLALGRFHLLGYSMGGRLALYTAVHHATRLKSLILESASPGLATESERETRITSDNALADRIEREGIWSFVDFWERLPLWESQQQLTPEVRQRLRDLRLQNSTVGLANSLRGMGTGQQPSLWDDLHTLTLPVLLLTGELDTKFEAINDHIVADLSNAQHTSITNAGHTVHLEQRDLYTQAVLQFLGGQGYCHYCGRVTHRCECAQPDSQLSKFLARGRKLYQPKTQAQSYKRGVPPQIKRRERDTLKRHYKSWYAELVETFGEQCLHCGEVENLAIDHIVSIARGGQSELNNLQLLCAECNRLKGKLVYDCRPHPLESNG